MLQLNFKVERIYSKNNWCNVARWKYFKSTDEIELQSEIPISVKYLKSTNQIKSSTFFYLNHWIWYKTALRLVGRWDGNWRFVSRYWDDVTLSTWVVPISAHLFRISRAIYSLVKVHHEIGGTPIEFIIGRSFGVWINTRLTRPRRLRANFYYFGIFFFTERPDSDHSLRRNQRPAIRDGSNTTQ